MSSGGTMPYSFQIGAEDFVSSPDEYGVFNNLSANTYEITVEDAENCTETISVVLGENSDIVVTPPVVTNAICPDDYGSFTISASGGVGPDYSYSSNGQINLDGQFDSC